MTSRCCIARIVFVLRTQTESTRLMSFRSRPKAGLSSFTLPSHGQQILTLCFCTMGDDCSEKQGVERLEAEMNRVSLHTRRATDSTVSSSPPVEANSAPASPVITDSKHTKAPSNPSPISKPPSLTLTPNSGDGTFLTASPFHGNEGPPIPYLHHHHRRAGSGSNFGSTGSFELQPPPTVNDHDGLVGLDALPSGDRPPSGLDASPRHRYTQRPPLSQPYVDMNNSGSVHFSANASVESTDTGGSRGGFGAIGSDASRRARSSSHDGQHPPGYNYQQQQEVAQKFGNFPLGPPPMKQAFMERPKHIRSVSQPGPPGLYGNNYDAPRTAQRSSSFHSSYEHSLNPRSTGSSPNLGQYYGSGYSSDRRDGLDFPGAGQGYVGSTDSSYGACTPPMSVSPGHSPHQVFYPSYHQHHETIGHLRPVPSSLPDRMHDNEEHPLMGENIEVPDHVDHVSYFGNRGHGHSHSMDSAYRQSAPSLALPKVVYSVKFKRSQRNFILGQRIMRDLEIGTYVKVEADRGEDLGIVIQKIPSEKFNTFSGRASFSAGDPAGLKRIIRLAKHEEVSLLGMKRIEEEDLLKVCRGKVRDRGLPMKVVDAEYQFDRHKLTFFFEAEGRVDFRELVRDLFSMYKTRIWMQQLDKNTSTSSPAILAPSTPPDMDFGTPIIAPASEFADSIMYPNSQP